MISELAPIILYIKYVLHSEKNFVIIEEPESHLHLNIQKIFAQFLVKLVRAGVKLLLTNHGDYFVQCINKFVRLYSNEEKRAKLGYNKDDFLNPKELNAYLFHFDPKNYGTTKKLEVDKRGIIEDHFAEFINEIYKNSIELDDDCGDN